jgi:hypothetical protein
MSLDYEPDMKSDYPVKLLIVYCIVRKDTLCYLKQPQMNKSVQ